MADQNVRGRFVWHELVTPDANAAHAFYGKTIGWKSQPWEQDPSYVMFATPRGPIGATVTGNGAAAHWLPYIGTANIDETIELARQRGGSVEKDIDTMSSGSRHALLRDPYGARFGVYESAEDYGKITPPKPGEHSWHELISTDHEGAFAFYSALFGWEKLVEHDMGPMGMYLIYGLGDVPFGGMMTMKSGSSPSWLSYVHVKDVNQTAKKVKSAGGQVIHGPMEVPGGDWIVQAVDPQGAMFAAHASAANMKPKQQSPEKNSPIKKVPANMSPENQTQNDQQQLELTAAETPPPVQDPETPASEQTPPADQPPEAPAQKAPTRKAPARKAPPQEAPPATEAPAEEAPAKQAPAKKSPAKKAPAKRAPAKKAPAKKSTKTPARKSSGKKAAKKKVTKKRPAAKGKRVAAKKGAKKKSTRAKSTRAAAKKKAVRKARRGK